MEAACKKNNDMRKNKSLITMYINPSYFFTIQKFLYFPFSASHNILKTRVFRNNAVTMRIHLPKKRPKVSLIKIKLLIFKEDFVFEYFLARI